MSISLRIRILLSFGPPNPNTLKKLEYKYIFSKLKESVNPFISRHKNPRIQLFSMSLSSLTFVLKLWHDENTFIWLESIWIHLWPRIGIHFIFAIEYEYNYPVRDMDLSPNKRSRFILLQCWPFAWQKSGLSIYGQLFRASKQNVQLQSGHLFTRMTPRVM